MQHQPTGGDIAAQDERTQRFVLTVVTNEEQSPWSVDEIVRTLERTNSRLAVLDAITQLRSIGLINQADHLVFASQAAAHVLRLGMLSI